MADEETRVLYKAIADFSELSKKALQARKDLRALKDEEKALNAESSKGSAAVTKSSGRHAAAAKQQAAAVHEVAAASKDATTATNQSTSALNNQASATAKAATWADRLADAQKRVAAAYDKTRKSAAAASSTSSAGGKRPFDPKIDADISRAETKIASVTRELEILRRMEATPQVDADTSKAQHALTALEARLRALRSLRAEMNVDAAPAERQVTALGRTFQKVRGQADTLNKSLDRLGDWRPRLMPPFIALIPVIGAVLGLINPLVAGLGAIGAAALGVAANVGSIAGAALSVVPALATLLSVVGALKMAFGGIGQAFKANTAMKQAQKTAGGGGGGAADNRVELTRAEQLERAWERYRRTIQDVQYAQDDLNDARAGYIKRIEEMRKAVERAAMSEARASANAQLARENYANILADPGSTKGQKMEALAGLDEAKAAVEDVRDENKRNADELAKAQATGIEGDRDVIMAHRRVTDAINAQRDAYIDIQNVGVENASAATAAANAANLFQDALDELSPSARATVLALLAMSDAWKTVRRNVQESFFSQVIGEVGLLRRLFPSLESMLSDTAEAAGKVAASFVRLITGDEWLADIESLGPQNANIIESLGNALLSVLNILRDLTVAVGPFAEGLANGIEQGASNMERLVSSARETGRLATWLETVNTRMEQWWRIIKNIGRTLFNYGVAAGDLGQWITDAFESVTEGWRTASESARKEGSPFRKYLEDIKPLLSEVGGLLGDFFGWFGREAKDTDNIDMMTDLISLIRDDLGPSLGGILDTLSKSGIAEQFFSALGSVLDTIQTFLDNGGAEGMGAFWDTAEVFFKAIAALIDKTPAPVIQAIATAFGVLAALRFFGLTKLLSLMLTLLNHKNLGMLLGGIARGASKVLGRGGAAAGGGVAAGRGIAAGTGALTGSLTSGGLRSTVTRALGAGGKGGIAGLVAGLVSEFLIKDGKGGARDTIGSVASGAASGAGLGAIVGSVVPGVGTAIGAGVGGVVGGGAAALGIDTDQWNKTADEIGSWWSETVVPKWNAVSDAVGNWWNQNVVAPFSRVGENIGKWWRENVTEPFVSVAGRIGGWWNENVVTPFNAFAGAMDRGWNQLVVEPFATARAHIEDWWHANVAAPFATMRANIENFWHTNVAAPFSRMRANIENYWHQNVAAPFSRMRTNIETYWHTNVASPFSRMRANIETYWHDNVAAPFSRLWGRLETGWKTYVLDPVTSITDAITTFVNKFKSFDLSDSLTDFFSGAFRGDGPGANAPGAAKGGSTLEKVKSIMPRGATITSTYRTPAQNRAVGGVPGSYHTDKNNPAVDIAGPTSMLDGLYARLKAIGGWRELLWRVKGHYDHVHVAHQGGTVSPSWHRSPGDKPDERTTRLQVGEVVVPKQLAPQFLADRNLNVPGNSFSGSNQAMGQTIIDQSVKIEKLEVNNPIAETTSESLPRTIRKVSYLGKGATA